MSQPDLAAPRHEHVFGQDRRTSGESRTLLVIALTGVTMVVEIGAGLAFGSMALLADGLHMASHATALAITAFAYRFARRHAADASFSFGTGKVNALAGFASAVLLVLFALMMAGESVDRFLHPVAIHFNEAIAVAVLGLLVNGVSVLILDAGHDHDHHGDHHRHHDHNLRAAYLHVVADALTSLLAIVALVAAKMAGAVWLDPAMGVVGAALVARWSWGLIRDTSRVLLDRQAPPERLEALRTAVTAAAEVTVEDLHLWAVAPGRWAAIVAVTSADELEPETLARAIPEELGVVHATIEIHRRKP